MQVPVARRNSAFLPILPAWIFFNGCPDFMRRKRNALCEVLHRASNVYADQDTPYVENDGLDLRVRPGHLSAALRSASANYPDYRRQNRKQNDCADDEMEILADVRNPRTQQITAEDHAAYPKNATADIEKQISRIGHFCGAGHGRIKGADDWD